jgi:O-methyltransferase
MISPLYLLINNVSSVRRRAQRAPIWWEFRQWCESHPCPEFANRFALYQSIFESERLDQPIDYLEFGVWKGESLRWWAEKNRDPSSSFHGFDSFEGLAESWEEYKQGAFSTSGAMPEVPDARCHFIKGYFHETLPGWLSGRGFANRLVIHFDADLYGSTLLAMLHLMPRMKPGTIFIFDEFNSFMHEFRAFRDALAAYPLNVAPLGHTLEWMQLGLKVV